MRPVRILVTGAGGQLGRALSGSISPPARDPRFTETDRLGNNTRQFEYDFKTRAQLDVTCIDHMARCLDALPIDIVINAAAHTAVNRAAADGAAVWAVNAEAPGKLARLCAARAIRLIHCSTDYVFDGTSPRPYRETDPTNPLNLYGRSKLAGEIAALQANPDTIILRTSWLFSAFRRNFVRTILNQASHQDDLRVAHDQIGGPTWAGHLAACLQATAAAAAAPDPLRSPMAGGIYHFSGAPWVSRFGLARAVIDEAQRIGLLARHPVIHPIRLDEWPAPEARPINSRLDGQKLMAELGPLERDWRIGLRQTLRTLALAASDSPS